MERLDLPKRIPTLRIDRLTTHRVVVAGVTVDLTFQRLGDRVVVFSQGHTSSRVRVLSHV